MGCTQMKKNKKFNDKPAQTIDFEHLYYEIHRIINNLEQIQFEISVFSLPTTS